MPKRGRVNVWNLSDKEFNERVAGRKADDLTDAEFNRIIAQTYHENFAQAGLNLIAQGYSLKEIMEIGESLTVEEKETDGKMIDSANRLAHAVRYRDEIIAHQKELPEGERIDFAARGIDLGNLHQLAAVADSISLLDREFSRALPMPGPAPTPDVSRGSDDSWWPEFLTSKYWWPSTESSLRGRKLDDVDNSEPPPPPPPPSSSGTPSPSGSTSPTPSVTATPSVTPSSFAEPTWWTGLLDGCGISPNVTRSYNQTLDQTIFTFTNSTSGNSTTLVLDGGMPFPATESAARSDGSFWGSITSFFADCILPSPSASPTPSSSPTASPSATTTPTGTPSVTPTPTPFGVDGWVYSLWDSCGIDPAEVTRTYDLVTDMTTFTRTFTYGNGTQAISRLEVFGAEPFPASEDTFRTDPSYSSAWSAFRTWLGDCVAASSSPSVSPSPSSSPSVSPSSSTSPSPSTTTTVSAAPTPSITPTPNVTSTSTPTSTPIPTPSPTPDYTFPRLPQWFTDGMEYCQKAINTTVFGDDTLKDRSDDRAEIAIGSGADVETVSIPFPMPDSRATALNQTSWFSQIREVDPYCLPDSIPSNPSAKSSSRGFLGPISAGDDVKDGLVVAGVGTLAIIACLVTCCCRRRNQKLQDDSRRPASSPTQTHASVLSGRSGRATLV